MITVGIYIKDATTLQYNRVELFSDEKISVNSSIQNVNDISKTFTDYSQTFVIPASKQNNKIFKHWYENSNDYPFNTLIKADAYIELDTILFRTGKIQLESATIKDNQPDSYSITFIGALGTLKDKFNGLFLKDLNDTSNDFPYTDTIVYDKVKATAASSDIMFPLITSNKVWTFGSGTTYPINISGTPIRTLDLFPAIRLSKVISMIDNDTKWNINFSGAFLTDPRFTKAYLWLKNKDAISDYFAFTKVDFTTKGTMESSPGVTVDLTDNSFIAKYTINKITITPSAGYTTVPYILKRYLGGVNTTTTTKSSGGIGTNQYLAYSDNRKQSFQIQTSATFKFTAKIEVTYYSGVVPTYSATMAEQTTGSNFSIANSFPEIKIEDFLAGIMKMFNLTCYSTDGINYTLDTLENYYATGTTRDLTKYIKSDNVNLNRVKSYKKINFEYEKSESVINTLFSQANGVEYGTLLLDTGNDGDEYNIKLPFEDLNFSNLNETFQVGYSLKNDFNKYIPKPVILYDYNPTALTAAGFNYYLSPTSSGTGATFSSYKAFGQEYFDGTNTYSLNFPAQQSTLTNVVIDNSLYNQYYENYLANIFDSKARLIKVSGILPTSLLTSLKLNDKILIRDKKYIINTMTTDLTTGEVQFELLTDFRVAI